MSTQYWRPRKAGALVALGILLLLLGIVILMVAPYLHGKWGPVAGAGQMVAAATGVIALGNGLVQFLSWWRKRGAPTPAPKSTDIATAKEILAGLATEQWLDETVLRSLSDPEPMPLPWRSTEHRELADHPEIIAKGTVAFPCQEVHIADMVRNFRALRCRRLVILGDPGTGKTTLAVQLMLELLRTRQPEEPVPVMVSATRWDDRVHPRLKDWLAASLAMDYPALCAESLGPDTPAALVARGEVLPVVDGLDELPERARTDMLNMLNRSMSDAGQLILTCRTEQFAKSVQELGDVLTAAAVIEPQPMSPAAAADYLRACLPPVTQPAWTLVLEALRTGAAPALSEVTSTSMGLWLVRATYIAPQMNPAPLLELGRGSAAELHDHLCDQLIPALVNTRRPADGPAQPFRPQHAWTPEQVDRWLRYLSCQLAHSTKDPRSMAWWHLARYLSSFPVRIGFAIAIGAIVGMPLWLVTGHSPASALVGLLSALTVMILTGPWFTESPGHFDFNLRDRRSELRPVVKDGVIFGVLGAVISWVVTAPRGSTASLLAAIQIGLLSAIGSGVLALIGWAERPTTATTARSPRSTWQADRTLTFIRIAGGLLIGVTAGGIWIYSAKAVQTPLIVGALLLGLLFGIMLGGHHAWLAYQLTILRLATKRRLPLRAMDFLDDAHRLGLLRTEGPYYQFRHIELQQHLTNGWHTASEMSNGPFIDLISSERGTRRGTRGRHRSVS